MEEIKLIVTLQVESTELHQHLSIHDLQQAASEAVGTALHRADQDGFVHAYADQVAIGLVDVEIVLP